MLKSAKLQRVVSRSGVSTSNRAALLRKGACMDNRAIYYKEAIFFLPTTHSHNISQAFWGLFFRPSLPKILQPNYANNGIAKLGWIEQREVA